MNSVISRTILLLVLVASFSAAWASFPSPHEDPPTPETTAISIAQPKRPLKDWQKGDTHPSWQKGDIQPSNRILKDKPHRGINRKAQAINKGDTHSSHKGDTHFSGRGNKGDGNKGDTHSSESIHTSVHADSKQINASGLAEDLDIPTICVSELPGLEFDRHANAIAQIRDQIRQNAIGENQSAGAHSSPGSILRERWSAERLPAFPDSSQVQQATYQANATGPAPAQYLPTQTFPSQQAPAWDSIPPSINQQTGAGQMNPHAQAANTHNTAYLKAAANPNVDPHLQVFSKTAFPSATECKTCHEQIYQEWSVSSHAYASVSPMFQKFEQRINNLTQGTIGYFCNRCHSPVATTLKQPRDQPVWDGPRVFREGVTCVACHRVTQAHGRDNGDRRMNPGDISQPIVAGGDGIGVEIVKKYGSTFKVKTDPKDKRPGSVMHRRSIQFDQLTKSTFCVSCHQVAVEPGIALEVVWNQYRSSPAYRNGTSCQDCHMGIVPGKDEGYSIGPAAVVNGNAVNPHRKHSNHQFYGPGYSIAHPGIFPQNPDADRWKFNQWLQFDWRAGWGTEQFEDALDAGQIVASFPPVWSDVDDRMDAREIVDANLKLLAYKRDMRRQTMENGSDVEGPFFSKPPTAGKPLQFHYKVKNISTGHNMPSGSLGAQPQLWLNVALIGPRGNRVWESGYLDSIGDLADRHSADVLAKRIPHDWQLFNLQTKFLTTNVKGTDREMYLPINVDVDQIPFIRPDARPNTVMNHPPLIRMEAHSIPATGCKKAKYSIPAHLMQEPGVYRLSVRLRSRAEPIYFMKDVKATPEMIQSMNEGILDVHAFSKTFVVR